MKAILIYGDNGTDATCVAETYFGLQLALNDHANIKIVDRNYLADNDWETQTQLLIIPGGRSLPYRKDLAHTANQKIIKYVMQGGNYLGICAGAYYASAKTIFEKGNKLEVICDGTLNFFPGYAEGPAYGLGKFSYDNRAGAKIAAIKWRKDMTDYPIYYNGGAYFDKPEQFSHVKVLASYADIHNQPAAIIQCQIGKGKVILSGVHIEYSYRAFKEELINSHEQAIYSQLKVAEPSRQKIFNDMLSLLGL